jgi:N-methylhydantoinase A
LSGWPGQGRAGRSKTAGTGADAGLGGGPGQAPGPLSSRQVCFDAEEGYRDTPVHWRPDLCAGDTFAGPAIVEEFGSTVPVHPGFTVRVDSIGNLVIRKEGAR